MLRKIEGEGEDRGWDGWMASPIWWTWVWVSSRSWWWTGKPGVLQSMGLQRVGHDWVTELNWTECVYVNSNPLKYPTCVWRATGTVGPLWKHTACHMPPAPSAPGHSSLGTQASQALGCDTSPGHCVLRGRESALLFCFCCVYLIVWTGVYGWITVLWVAFFPSTTTSFTSINTFWAFFFLFHIGYYRGCNVSVLVLYSGSWSFIL